MKVIEHGECYEYGNSGKIRCKCGCLFEYNKGDVQKKDVLMLNTDPKKDKRGVESFVLCPECGNEIRLSV